VQLLNDILTKSTTSAHKLSRKQSVTSPDFRKAQSRQATVGYQTHRMTNQGSNDYTTILSEINNMIEHNQLRLSAQKNTSHGGILKNSYVVSSPSVNQLNPCMSFNNQRVLTNSTTKENHTMRRSDLH
jgi:hypothetical protein